MKLVCTLTIALLVASASDAVAQGPGSTLTSDQIAQICGQLGAEMQACVDAGVAAGIDEDSSKTTCAMMDMIEKRAIGCALLAAELLGAALSPLFGR